jgi:hypothetical protein
VEGRDVSLRTVLRLRCDGCERNLADVTVHNNKVQVVARTSASVAHYVGSGGQVRDGRVVFDASHETFSIRCRCGRQSDRRAAALLDYWRANAELTSSRIVFAILDRDL